MSIKATSTYNLQIINPLLAKEWHPTKNGELKPGDFTPHSGKRVWWICEHGHDWLVAINNRSNGFGCPYCSGRLPSKENCLQIVNPTLAKEWHPTKNGNITPRDVTPRAGKKVWWLCEKGHEWQMTVDSRGRGYNCPYCSGRMVNEENCLQTGSPTLAKEWHPAKNGNLTPRDVTAHSNKKVWWLCKKGHEWRAIVADRSSGKSCPYCSGRAVCDDNCLQTVNPGLAKEWHPTKNGVLTPKDFVSNSTKRAWWLCKKGHEWKASINNRNWGNGCPFCHSQTSSKELRVYTELKCLFKNVYHRKKIYGVECDVYVPDIKLAIEVDSLYWHKNKYREDKRKTDLLKEKGIFLLRIRDEGLEKVSPYDVVSPKREMGFSLLERIIIKMLQNITLTDSVDNRLKVYLKNKALINENEFINMLSMLPSPLPGCSLDDLNKDLAKQWHPTKNGNLTPRDVTAHSNKKVWWVCEKGHEWIAMINNRSNNRGCPYCSGRRK